MKNKAFILGTILVIALLAFFLDVQPFLIKLPPRLLEIVASLEPKRKVKRLLLLLFNN